MLPETKPTLYFLEHERQRRPNEWDLDKIGERFLVALEHCDVVKDLPGLRWTVV